MYVVEDCSGKLPFLHQAQFYSAFARRVGGLHEGAQAAVFSVFIFPVWCVVMRSLHSAVGVMPHSKGREGCGDTRTVWMKTLSGVKVTFHYRMSFNGYERLGSFCLACFLFLNND